MTNWSELPSDLLVLIAKRLICMEDFLAFGAVCNSWLLAADKNNFDPSQQQPPWLMLRKRKNKTSHEYFLSLTTLKIYKFPKRDANGKKYLASQGWLFAIGKDFDVNLIHPLSGARVPLPQMRTLKDSDCLFDRLHLIYKAILSTNNPNDSRVAIIYGSGINKVAFCKVGEETWKTVEAAYPSSAIHDLVYYKGRCYGVDILARVWVYDHEASNAQVLSTIPREFLPSYSTIRKPWQYFERFYLVESAGSLLVVSREGKSCGHVYGTTGFRVLELDVEDGVWKRVNSLANRALFLGHSSSFSVQVAGKSGCKADCIYFTDDNSFSSYPDSLKGKGKDKGIYSMRDGSFERHFRGETHYDCDDSSIWIEPTFGRAKY